MIVGADWVIELGLEGAAAGCQVVAATTPDAMVHLGAHPGVALAAVLRLARQRIMRLLSTQQRLGVVAPWDQAR